MGLWPAGVWSEIPPGLGGVGAGDTSGGSCAASTVAPTLSGVVFWGAADRLTGYAEGDPVGSFTDLSGNSRHATAAGANRPTYRAAVTACGGTAFAMGKPGLEYVAGSGTKLVVPSVTYNPSTFTIALVVALTTDAGILYEFASTSGCYCYGDTGNTLKQDRAGTVSAREATSAWAYTVHKPKLIVAQYGGTNALHTLRVNKAAVTLSDTTADNPGSASLTSTLSLLSRDGSLSCTGYLFETWVLSPVVSAGNLALLEDYLYSRWCLGNY